VSFADVIAVLRAMGFAGYVSFEWEKYWHPEIEEPEIALADFAEATRNCRERRALT
jgi:sugar phosphate isomerase/epimerase